MSTLRGHTITLVATPSLTTETCSNCGVLYAMASDFRAKRLQDRRDFYCPSGHSQRYIGKTDEQKLKEQLDAARSLANREADRRRQAEAEQAAARGRLDLIRRRVGNGVCPCCNRTFADLGQHIAGQHPEFRLDDDEPNPTLTITDLSPNQRQTLEGLASDLNDGLPGADTSYIHAATLQALVKRSIVELVDVFDEQYAVPTATGLRLIVEAASS